MRLLEDLERLLAREESMFRAQLLREDIARLQKVRELARAEPDAEAFRKAALRIGWTAGDARTHELREPLEALLSRIHAFERSGASDNGHDEAILEAWNRMQDLRMERLLGCLSTPAPRPGR